MIAGIELSNVPLAHALAPPHHVCHGGCERYRERRSFPLHYTVFKQTASHIPHEGNSEQLFSRSGMLSDNNGRGDPARLATWTSIGVNYDTFQPSYEKILERYLLKFRKHGKKLHEDDLGLLEPESEGEKQAESAE